MRLMGIVILALTVNAVAASQAVGDPVDRQGQSEFAASECNERVFFDELRPVLIASGYAGRLYYAGQCAVAGTDFVRFPVVKTQHPIGNGFRAIESLFRDDKNVKVSMKPGKIVSITIGSVSTAVLQTVIPVFRLAPLGQYNPSLAIGSLVNTPAMEGKMNRLGLQFPLSLSEELLAQPANGLPHLPGDMDGMTADQILDSIAVTFRGVVVYGISSDSRTRMYSIEFVGLGQDIQASASHQ
jgi:hypothetical protein